MLAALRGVLEQENEVSIEMRGDLKLSLLKDDMCVDIENPMESANKSPPSR